eukprot:1761374-Rhodomonas_salina.1
MEGLEVPGQSAMRLRVSLYARNYYIPTRSFVPVPTRMWVLQLVLSWGMMLLGAGSVKGWKACAEAKLGAGAGVSRIASGPGERT